MTETPQLLANRCESVLTSVLELASHLPDVLRFNKRDAQQLYAVCLYLRLLELAVGCKVMLEKNTLVGIPILLRSMFEADIDLTNVMKCRDYPKRMRASFLEQRLRLTIEAASSRPNPFLADIRKNPKEDLDETRAELNKLKDEKNGPISIRCRAELAGNLDEYLSVYNMLCLDTHNNIRSLEQWHLDVTDTDQYHAVAFKVTKADILHYLSAIPGILLVQSKALADFLDIEGIEFERYFEELRGMQNEVKTCATGEANRVKTGV
jgi:hypothetical protein